MQKKMMALAVAGALAAPGVAFAQASTVQIYGTIVENSIWGYDRGGPASPAFPGAVVAPCSAAAATTQNCGAKTHDFLQSHDSELGVRGEEALGGGLSAWFQCASTIDLNSGPASTLCGKNSAVGFKGGWGNAFVGMWDTPHKLATAQLRPFSTSGIFGVGSQLWSGAGSNIGNGAASGSATQSNGSFTRRQKNLISYWSPNWGGFDIKAAFSQANEATVQTDATVASKPRLWSVGATYANGPLLITGGYEKHKNYNTAVLATGSAFGTYGGGDDRNWSGGAAYTFAGVFKLSGVYSDSKYEVSNGGDMKVKAWGIYGDWAIMGPHRLRLGYTHNKDTKGTAGTIAPGVAFTPANIAAARLAVGTYTANGGAGGTASTLYGIQYAYAFSKRTELNFGYARVNNDDQAAHALQTSGAGISGQDQSAWSLGIKHTF